MQITIGLPPYTYSRLALLAHRRNHPLGDEIRAALHTHVEAHAEWLKEGQRTITRVESTDST